MLADDDELERTEKRLANAAYRARRRAKQAEQLAAIRYRLSDEGKAANAAVQAMDSKAIMDIALACYRAKQSAAAAVPEWLK